MPEQRRRFSAQFKAEAVQMVIETGRSIAEVARDLGIHDGTLGNWVNGWRRAHPEPDQPLTPVERAHVKELEDEHQLTTAGKVPWPGQHPVLARARQHPTTRTPGGVG